MNRSSNYRHERNKIKMFRYSSYSQPSKAFIKVKKTIISKIEEYKRGYDVIDSLEGRKLIDLTLKKPIRKLSKLRNSQEELTPDGKIKQNFYDIEYELFLERYIDRIEALEQI